MPRRPQALQVAIGEQPYRAGHGDDALAARLHSSTPVLRTSLGDQSFDGQEIVDASHKLAAHLGGRSRTDHHPFRMRR